MTDRHDDLSWDYNETAELENTPLLARLRQTKQRKSSQHKDDVAFSRLQVELLLQCFKDSTTMLNNNLRHGRMWVNSEENSAHSKIDIRPADTQLRNGLNTCADWMLLWTFLIQAISVLVNYITEVNVRGPPTAENVIITVAVCSSCGNFIPWLTIFAKTMRDLHQNTASLWQALMVYVCGMLVFAGLYTATFTLQNNSWVFNDKTGKDESHITYYGQFLVYSISIGTMQGCNYIYPSSWDTKIVTCVQMIITLTQLVVLLVLCLCRSFRTSCTHAFPTESKINNDPSHHFEDSYDVRGTPLYQSSDDLYGSLRYGNYTSSIPSQDNNSKILDSVNNGATNTLRDYSGSSPAAGDTPLSPTRSNPRTWDFPSPCLSRIDLHKSSDDIWK